MLAGLQASSLLCQINIPSPAHTPCLEMMSYQLRPHPYSCPHSASRRKRCPQQKMCFAVRRHHRIKGEEIGGPFAPVPCCWHGGYLCALSTARTISSLGRAADQVCRYYSGTKKEQGLHKSIGGQAQNSLLARFQTSTFENWSWCLPTALFLASALLLTKTHLFLAKDLWFLCANPVLANLLEDVCLAGNDASSCINKY